MSHDLQSDRIEQELRDCFMAIQRDVLPEENLETPDFEMKSWEEIEQMADEWMEQEPAEDDLSDTKYNNGKTLALPKKRVLTVLLAATMGTLLFAGVANGDRMYRYVTGQRLVSGQNEMNVDSNKIFSDRDNPYGEAVNEILIETQVNSVQSMDFSWELVEYEIEGKYSYLTFQKEDFEVLVKQRSYAGTDISMLQVSDKEYCGEEQNNLIKELVYQIYSEKTYDGGMSYETRFTLSDAIYIVQAKCSEEEFRSFLKDIYIKHTLQ